MFKPVARFVLIAVSTLALFASAGAQATAPRMAPAASTARPAAAPAKSADCQPPATVGEDYQGLSCTSTSAGAQANARRIDPASSVARSPAAAPENSDCQPPATVGEDYQGLSCAASTTNLPVLLAPAYSVGEDFSGPEFIAVPEDSLTVSHHLQLALAPAMPAAAGSN